MRPSSKHVILIALIAPFMVLLVCTVAFTRERAGPQTHILKGEVVKINVDERYFEIQQRDSQKRVRIYVDDPGRLRFLRPGIRVKVRVQKGQTDPSSFMAEEIRTPGSCCRCDPTGVRMRMRRSMGSGRGMGMGMGRGMGR